MGGELELASGLSETGNLKVEGGRSKGGGTKLHKAEGSGLDGKNQNCVVAY